MSTYSIDLRFDQYLEVEKIALGSFYPLTGFMTQVEFLSVCETMRLPNGTPFPIPIILDINKKDAVQAMNCSNIELNYKGEMVARLFPNSIFNFDKLAVAEMIFGVNDKAHPGVSRFFNMDDWFIGGEVSLIKKLPSFFGMNELSPEDTKLYFKERGWKSIVGFQTRNVPHRAHEYLQRTALELVDGLFIQPLVGQKRKGDYTPDAIIKGYRCLVENFYPSDRVLLGVLSTSMRYAGPREAVFHALIRKNYGCTHFIIGRDHAGVANYYGKYDAHILMKKFEKDLGISIMYLHGPYYCSLCDGIVTEHTCPHLIKNPAAITEISGTIIRRAIVDGDFINPAFLRPQILDALVDCNLFIE